MKNGCKRHDVNNAWQVHNCQENLIFTVQEGLLEIQKYCKQIKCKMRGSNHAKR